MKIVCMLLATLCMLCTKGQVEIHPKGIISDLDTLGIDTLALSIEMDGFATQEVYIDGRFAVGAYAIIKDVPFENIAITLINGTITNIERLYFNKKGEIVRRKSIYKVAPPTNEY